MKLSFPTILAALLFAVTAFVLNVTPQQAEAEYADVVLNEYSEDAGMRPVVFPHWFHRIRFKCKACHEHIYLMKAGANETNMNKILAGESCGTCHNDEVAWGADYCDRCHSRKPGWVPENYPKKIKKEKK